MQIFITLQEKKENSQKVFLHLVFSITECWIESCLYRVMMKWQSFYMIFCVGSNLATWFHLIRIEKKSINSCCQHPKDHDKVGKNYERPKRFTIFIYGVLFRFYKVPIQFWFYNTAVLSCHSWWFAHWLKIAKNISFDSLHKLTK